MLQLIAKSGRGRAPKPIAEALAGGRSLDEFLIEKLFYSPPFLWRALSFEISVYFDDNSHVSFLGVGSTDFMVNDLLLFSVSVLVFLVIILMLHLTLKTDSILSEWICPYISRHLLSLNPLLACCRRYSRGER